MSERPTQAKQIGQVLEKLDAISERLARIETKVEYQPKIDEKRFESLEKHEVNCRKEYDKVLANHDQRIIDIEKKPAKRWEVIVTAFLSSAIGALIGYISRS